MKEKKAISDIVSTVLIIMIAVAAVGIITAIVIPMVKNSLQGADLCNKAMGDITVNPSLVCREKGENGNDTIRLVIQKGSDDELQLSKASIQLKKADGSSDPKIVVLEGLVPNQAKAIEINVSNTSGYTSLSVAPILKNGKKEKTCDFVIEDLVIADCN